MIIIMMIIIIIIKLACMPRLLHKLGVVVPWKRGGGNTGVELGEVGGKGAGGRG